MKIKTRNIAELVGKNLKRAFSVRAANINTELRTVDLAFSSEEVAAQDFGLEKLSHAPGAIDLSRLLDGAPLLWMHDMHQQIGVVESARIDSDRVGRATVRFSRSAAGEENFVDVVEGIKSKVSVGYQILEWMLESRDPVTGEETYIITKWLPYEISLVSVPADNTVGVGRSINVEAESKTKNTTEQKSILMKERLAALRAIASKYQSRVKSGIDLAQVAVDFALDGKSDADFNQFVLENTSERSAPAGSIEVKTGGVASDNAVRSAIQDVVASKGARSLKLGFGKRTFDGSTNAGGEMIGLQMQETIPSLKAKSVLLGLGAKLITGATSNIRYPRITGALAASWKAKGAAAGASAPVTGSAELAPKRLTITFNLDKALLAQVPDMDMILREEINAALAAGLDKAGIIGAGTDEPTGILGTSGVGGVTFGVGGITWAKVCEFLGAVETQNYDAASCGWFVNPATMAKAMSTLKAEGVGGYIMENRQIAGYTTKVSNNVGASNKVVFGDAAQTVFALFGDGYDVTMDPFTRAGYGEIVVTAQVLADFAVLQPGAFAVSTDAATS